jgi:hypothetical protein
MAVWDSKRRVALPQDFRHAEVDRCADKACEEVGDGNSPV